MRLRLTKSQTEGLLHQLNYTKLGLSFTLVSGSNVTNYYNLYHSGLLCRPFLPRDNVSFRKRFWQPKLDFDFPNFLFPSDAISVSMRPWWLSSCQHALLLL